MSTMSSSTTLTRSLTCIVTVAGTLTSCFGQTAGIASASPSFQVFTNISSCNELHDNKGTKSPWGRSDGRLKYLGVFETNKLCLSAAAGWTNASDLSQRCLSSCYWKNPNNQSLLNQCYCYSTPTWMPLPSTMADSSVLTWPCTGRRDCSYNGDCTPNGSGCNCDAAWGGVRCGELQLLPVNRSTPGFREVNVSNNGSNVSTWGAPVLWDEKSAQWHGWASEMKHECGINAWETNSQIIHIVGDSPFGPFQRKEVFAPPFAHEPDVMRGPHGEWVMMYSAYNSVTRDMGLDGYNATELEAAACTSCKSGGTPPQGSAGCPIQRGVPKSLGHKFIQMMAISDTADGPWKQQTIQPLTTAWDWNTALTINTDSSAVALIRGGMVWAASNYSDNTTWRPVGVPRGEQSPQWPTGVEDPYIWRDHLGVYHALAHAFTPFYGVHAYVHPEDVPKDLDDNVTAMIWTLGGVAYGNVVNFTSGGSFAFSRRERPHLVWAKGLEGRVPIALTNGVEYGTQANTANQDMIFTLSQPLRQDPQQP